jgi:lipopolysaccharide/colanic/teichoic acid biosynthesis glycosyltransferase
MSNCASVGYRFAKRGLDVLVSAALLAALAPLGALIAILIKLDSSGPVLFVQRAVGLNEREFRLLKFRSMIPGSQDAIHRADIARNVRQKTPTTYDEQGRPVFKTAMANTARITRVGRILRRTSLDELPQLWNVLVGDMSLVGPRPSLPWEFELLDPAQRARLEVKPGMTGLYQVTARNRVPVAEMIRIDLDYVRRRSFFMDMKLLARTPLAMLKGL